MTKEYIDILRDKREEILINFISNCSYMKLPEKNSLNINERIELLNIFNNKKINKKKFNGCIKWRGSISKKRLKGKDDSWSMTPLLNFEKRQLNVKHISIFIYYDYLPLNTKISQDCEDKTCINPTHFKKIILDINNQKKRKNPFDLRPDKNKKQKLS